MVITDR